MSLPRPTKSPVDDLLPGFAESPPVEAFTFGAAQGTRNAGNAFMESLTGHLLIATPRLADPNFRRSVVLLLQHTDEGALGVILNRPTSAKVSDIWAQLSDKPCPSDAALYLGGPVEGPLLAVHNEQQASDEVEFMPGLFFTPESSTIEELVSAGGPLRLFVGYAGWGGGQLEQEMQDGSWLTCPAKAQYIFEPSDSLWEQLLRMLGRESLISALGIKHVPADPRLN